MTSGDESYTASNWRLNHRRVGFRSVLLIGCQWRLSQGYMSGTINH
jgi:hypothetical protein